MPMMKVDVAFACSTPSMAGGANTEAKASFSEQAGVLSFVGKV